MSDANPALLTQAVRDVLKEREHQIVDLGFGSDHDDEHAPNELPQAATSYMLHSAAQLHPGDRVGFVDRPPPMWPWERHWWKPRAVRENLVRAVALGLAAIETIDRAEARKGKQGVSS